MTRVAELAIVSRLDAARRSAAVIGGAVVGLIERGAAAHFKVRRAELRLHASWPAPSAKARAAVIYILATELSCSRAEAAAPFGLSGRRAREAIDRVLDLRDAEPGFDHWLNDISAAMRRE